ncbi:YGGT family protein [Plasmodium brasilianum]|uniref:YGGT family protein n=1 Tax=Plasmodium brasilianum TaxID=5824 RepID=A0ACB9YAQ8_PLABR|nr:YGGT family protein [Plasmodium brasilianum]
MKISKFKAFIIQSQNDKYGIFNIRNNSFKKIKEIQKNFKSNIFVQEQIKNISRKINTFKLHLFYSLPLPSVLKYLKLSGNSLRLSVLHFIRIYKFIIYIRCLLEWLPQINPHLNPFKNIPSVMGIDLSGVLSWLFLEMIESYLS